MFLIIDESDQRLQKWRDLRKRTHESASDVVREFADLRAERRYIDYYTPEDWPNPFDIVRDGEFDVTGISIVIAATLVHKELIKPDCLMFDVLSNHIDGNTGAYLRIENEYFNFVPGEINTLHFVQQNSTVYETHCLNYDHLMKK